MELSRLELHPVATLLIVGAGGVVAGIIGALWQSRSRP